MEKGRPTDYSDELADRICELISTSSKGLNRICEENDDFPHVVTVYRWIDKHEYFRNKYTRARESQADLMAAEIIEIADDGSNDTITNPITGAPMIDTEWVQRSRLRVDARKWAASKLAPKKYGDRLDVTSEGKAIPAPQIIVVNTDDEAE